MEALKLWLMSDLHLERMADPYSHHPVTTSPHDVVVLAGDILGSPSKSLRWAHETFGQTPVIFVAGNHEFYEPGCIERKVAGGKRYWKKAQHLHYLHDSSVVIGGVRFLGCTLWTAYQLDMQLSASMKAAAAGMNDHRQIRFEDDRPFMPGDAQQLHNESLAFLEGAFAEPFDGPTVVVTHHAPSRMSIHEEFGDDPPNAAFASEMDSLIAKWQPELWIHGHVHRSCDYSIGKTRVVCNPRGYDGGDRGYENPGFDGHLIAEVPTPYDSSRLEGLSDLDREIADEILVDQPDALDRLAKMADDLEAEHGIYPVDFEGGKTPKGE